MKVLTINVNGIRSAYKKGLFDWLGQIDADIICLQEIKAHIEDIPQELHNWNGYYSSFHSADKRGYSGVAIYAKITPKKIVVGLNSSEIDTEGRYIQFDYPEFSVASIYLPSGSSGMEKQEKKFRFMNYYQPILQEIINSQREFIICGDWNIAHQEIDLKNWKGNLKNSGFLPEERAWLSHLLQTGYVDTWRQLYPNVAGYTWWSNRGQAYTNNVGWRIDYQICTPSIGKYASTAHVYKEQKFSDHAPLIVEYNRIIS